MKVARVYISLLEITLLKKFKNMIPLSSCFQHDCPIPFWFLIAWSVSVFHSSVWKLVGSSLWLVFWNFTKMCFDMDLLWQGLGKFYLETDLWIWWKFSWIIFAHIRCFLFSRMLIILKMYRWGGSKKFMRKRNAKANLPWTFWSPLTLDEPSCFIFIHIFISVILFYFDRLLQVHLLFFLEDFSFLLS